MPGNLSGVPHFDWPQLRAPSGSSPRARVRSVSGHKHPWNRFRRSVSGQVGPFQTRGRETRPPAGAGLAASYPAPAPKLFRATCGPGLPRIHRPGASATRECRPAGHTVSRAERDRARDGRASERAATQQTGEPGRPEGCGQQRRPDEYPPAADGPCAAPGAAPRHLQVPAAAKRRHVEGQQGPREHPQRGRRRRAGRRRSDDSQHGREHSSPGEGRQPAQHDLEGFLDLEQFQHWVTPRSSSSARYLV